MQMRSTILLIIVLAIAALAALNWELLAASTAVSLGLMTFEAPLGLLMLGLTTLLGVFFVAYVLSLQASVLMETRRHTKEMLPSANWPTRPRHRVLPNCAAFSKPSMCRPRLPYWRAWTAWSPIWRQGLRNLTTPRPPAWGSWSSSCGGALATASCNGQPQKQRPRFPQGMRGQKMQSFGSAAGDS